MMKAKVLAAVLAVGALAMGCDSKPDRVDRWATTENTSVNIDFDKVNAAYKEASGPEDFEKRVNEIYGGDEVISVAVQDQDNKTQVVTGFFDKNTNGKVDEGEKVFTIKREPTPDGAAQYQTVGHGMYSSYASPLFGIASGMLLGSMISSVFMPSYVPMYATPYVTPAARVSSLHSQRSSYRASRPAMGPRSQTGRNYGGTAPSRPTSRPSTGRSGGGSFGLARAGRAQRPERLVA